MPFAQAVAIENTDKFLVWSYGNGAAYELVAKDRPGYRNAFLQGDDATQWREDYDNMCIAALDEKSVWYRKTWNQCLAHLIMDYIEIQEAA